MKSIKVVVERWLEVPDEWDLFEPEFTGQVHIKTDHHCIIPELTWLILQDHSDETCGWQEAGPDLKERIGNMMMAGACSVQFQSNEDDD